MNRYEIDKDTDEILEEVRDFLIVEGEAGAESCEIDLGKGLVWVRVGTPIMDLVRSRGWVLNVSLGSRVLVLTRPGPLAAKEDGRKLRHEISD